MNKALAAVVGAVSILSSGCCVARGTLVSTPRGLRRIEELAEQDAVWCVNPLTGERVESRLVQVSSSRREVMRLEGASFSLRCTTDHPLYDPLAKAWADAGDWVLGKRTSLLLVEEGLEPRVVEVTTRAVAAGVDEVFDLSVEHELHNFVASGVLVHNKKLAPPPLTCSAADGGQATERTECRLPDGGLGFVRCECPLPDGGDGRPEGCSTDEGESVAWGAVCR